MLIDDIRMVVDAIETEGLVGMNIDRAIDAQHEARCRRMYTRLDGLSDERIAYHQRIAASKYEYARSCADDAFALESAIARLKKET